MTPQNSAGDFDAAAYLSAAAPAVGLTLTAEQFAGAVTFLQIAAQMSDVVYAAPLDPDTFDLAPVFRPGEADQSK